MPSARVRYNDEVIETHRQALAALRQLLAETTDPTERRRLATTMLKARLIKAADYEPDPEPQAEPSPVASARSAPLLEADTGASPHTVDIAPHPAFAPDNARPLGSPLQTAIETRTPHGQPVGEARSKNEQAPAQSHRGSSSSSTRHS